MARATPKPPRREDIPELERSSFDYVYDRESRKHRDPTQLFELKGYFGAMLNSPLMAELYSRLGSLFRTAGERDSFKHWEREITDQVISAEWKTNVVMEMHVRDAVAVGVRPEAIDAIRKGDDTRLTADELEVVSYIRQVIHGNVTAESFQAMVRRFGSLRIAVEYTGWICFLMMTMRNMEALGCVIPTDEQIDRLIAGYVAGTEPIPDPKRGFN